MAYATQTQIQIRAGGATRLLEIADHDGNGEIDAEVIAAAQNDADAHIDRHTGKRFASLIGTDALPVAAAVELAAHECVYYLRSYIGQVSQDDIDRRAERLAELVKLATGETVPSTPLPAASTIPQSAFVEIDDDNEDGVLTRGNLEGPF